MAPARRRSSRIADLKTQRATKTKRGPVVVKARSPPKKRTPPVKPKTPIQQYFRLLDLPLDIRDIIYSYFASFANDDVVDPYDGLTIAARRVVADERNCKRSTRKALLQVCRQIEQEWAPKQFYRTTTILFKPRLQSGDDELPETEVSPYLGANVLLNTFAAWKLSCIRQISFDATKRSGTHLAGLRGFAHDLSKTTLLEKLTALTTITLYARSSRGGYHPSGSSRPTPAHAWKFAERAGWPEIENMLAHRSRGAALRHWQLARKVAIVEYKTSTNVDFQWTEGIMLRFTKCKSEHKPTPTTEIVYSKPGQMRTIGWS